MLHLQVDPLNREGRLQLLVGTAQTHAHKTRQLKRARGLFTNKTNRIMKCLQRTIFTRLIVARKLTKLVENRSLSRPPKNHVTIHNGERPHKCPSCGKSFIHLSHFKRHMMIHNGEFPFKCTSCGKSFICSSELKRHMMIHNGERPHKCTSC